MNDETERPSIPPGATRCGFSMPRRRAHALPFERLIPALREMFRRGCAVPRRQVHEIVAPDGGVVTSLVMPAWLPGRYYGVKTVNIAPGNAARGLPGLHASLSAATTRAPACRWRRSTATRSPRAAPPPPRRSPPRGWRGPTRGGCSSSARAGSRACCRKPFAPCCRSSRSASGRARRRRPTRWPPSGGTAASTRAPRRTSRPRWRRPTSSAAPRSPPRR